MTRFADGPLGVLQAAMWQCYLDFNGEKRRLGDLKQLFWVALEDLQTAIEGGETAKIREVFAEARKQLGAPGDFGYDTPHGKSLKSLYDAWNDWLKSLPAMSAAVTG